MIFRFDHVWKIRIEKLEKAYNELSEQFDRYKEKVVGLAMQSHTPQNLEEKYVEMEERIEALEKKTTMFR
jgi:predicted RNase H-like nuclease (RuvC/YqgF family)